MAIWRNRPQSQGDNSLGGPPTRSNGYGDAYVVPVGTERSTLCEEGSYFTANNLTTATEITGHAAAAIGDEATKPLLYLYNGGEKYITIDQVYIRVETINASSSDTYFTVTLTNEQSRDSGGTQLTVNNARSDNPNSSGATVWFGAVVCTPSASRLHSRHLIRDTIMVTEDRYHFQFGVAHASGSHAPVATVADVHRVFPPCVIAPGGEFLLASINPSGAITAATHEVMLGFWER